MSYLIQLQILHIVNLRYTISNVHIYLHLTFGVKV